MNEVTVDELAEALAAGARLVDVRELDEYVGGHVAGAVHVPLATVPDRIEAFVGDGPCYVICALGGRSARACQFLAQHDIDTINVAGGTQGWINSGRPVVGGTAS
jgi:rhodanese-related sulfurtransferase